MSVDLEILGAALGVRFSRSVKGLLRRFEALLRDRAVPIGLVSEGDAERIWTRHILDGMRAVAAVEPGDTDAYDLGSGAGLPGVLVAIARPDLAVGLVETRRRAIGFLELAVDELDLPNVRVVGGRIEELTDPVDLCFARALAPLRRSWSLARQCLRSGGRMVYFAGREAKLPMRVPGAREARLLETPVLESTGPLVIMTRQ